jgi:hypothetical protein
LIDELEQSASRGEVGRVRDLSDKLKGSCLSVGAVRLGAVSQAVEVAAKGGSLDASAIGELRALFVRASAAILAETPSGNGTDTSAREPT